MELAHSYSLVFLKLTDSMVQSSFPRAISRSGRKEFPSLYGTRNFITVFIRARRWALFSQIEVLYL